MKEDDEGFLRPHIVTHQCVGCERCESVCPMKHEQNNDAGARFGVYAAVAKEDWIHKKSQSGGVFYILGQKVLDAGGVVYGAALDDDFVTRHQRADTNELLRKIQGVKYVQSEMGDSFRRVAEDLRAGRFVLFSGTPCQVAGLRSFLASKHISEESLLTVDVVCYGVPSPGVFRQWIAALEQSYRSKVTEMCFRRTDSKWGEGRERYVLADGTVLEGAYYTNFFFNDLICRPSCETCRFCNTARVGDITLGDFWGIKETMQDFYDDRGVSLVFCNTEKGDRILAASAEAMHLRSSSLEAAVAAQPRLRGIAVCSDLQRRAAFWKSLHKESMRRIAVREKMLPPSLMDRVRYKLVAVKRRLKR